MTKDDWYLEYAKTLLQMPVSRVEAELQKVREQSGEQRVERIVSQFSRARIILENENHRRVL